MRLRGAVGGEVVVRPKMRAGGIVALPEGEGSNGASPGHSGYHTLPHSRGHRPRPQSEYFGAHGQVRAMGCGVEKWSVCWCASVWFGVHLN